MHTASALPREQATPQPPQFAVLVLRLTSQPLPGRRSQSAKPVLQVNPHAPARHCAVALAGAGQALLHAPQWATAVWLSVSQPLVRLPSQLPKPVLQRSMAQVPASHEGVARGNAQLRPQAPQWEVLVVRLASQPLAAMPSQLSKPASQVPTAHALALHTAVARGRLHAALQARQWRGSLVRLTSQPLPVSPSQSANPAEHPER